MSSQTLFDSRLEAFLVDQGQQRHYCDDRHQRRGAIYFLQAVPILAPADYATLFFGEFVDGVLRDAEVCRQERTRVSS